MWAVTLKHVSLSPHVYVRGSFRVDGLSMSYQGKHVTRAYSEDGGCQQATLSLTDR